MDRYDGLLAPFLADPGAAAVLVDFDGTLAPIVEDPTTARAVAGAAAALRRLRDRYRTVAVVSGRPVAFLVEQLPPELDLYGLYGLEHRVAGVVAEHAEAAGWDAVVGAVAARARDELPAEVGVEEKGRSLTLHVRTAPQHAAVVEAWAAEVVRIAGLEARRAKRSVELHPPVGLDKGTVVDRLTEGCRSACFVGDDLGDLPAFDALDRFAARGGHAVRVVVRSEETAPELLGRADLTVPDQAAAVGLLEHLAG